MPATDRPPSGAVRIFVASLLCFIVAAPLESGAAPQRPPAQASALEAALRAGALDNARALIPENWAAAEGLFVSYLERAFLSPAATQPGSEPRQLAARLADIFFRIVEYDVAQSIIATLDTADPARRQALVAAVRDYYATLERFRSTYSALPAAPGESDLAASQRRQRTTREIVASFTVVADRFRDLGAPRAELFTLRSMTGIGSEPQPRTDQLAARLGDELSLVRKRPYTEASLAMAERLGLPRLQASIISTLAAPAVTSTDPVTLERAAKQFERARALWRGVPSLEYTKFWLPGSPAPAPVGALSSLWAVYLKLNRPASESQAVFADALAISRPFGEAAVNGTLVSFAGRALDVGGEAPDLVAAASQPFGAKTELWTLRALSGAGRSYRPDACARALQRALEINDPHEQAVMLEWYARMRYQTMLRDAPPPVFEQLLQRGIKSGEVALVTDAMAYEADIRFIRGEADSALALYNEAIAVADRAGDPGRAAGLASRAASSESRPGPRVPSEIRYELATRAIEYATRAGSSLELAKALRTRAMAPVGTTRQSYDDILGALAAAEAYTAESGDADQELRCLRALAEEQVMRGEPHAAVETQRRRAELSRKQELPSYSTHEVNAHEELANIYAQHLGEPALALEAADRVRQLLEASVLGADRPAGPIPLANAYNRLAQVAVLLDQPSAAFEYWNKAIAKATEAARSGATTGFELSARRRALAQRAELYAALGDYDAALTDLAAVGVLIPQTKAIVTASEAMQRAQWATSVAWVHMRAGAADKALASAREAIGIYSQDTSRQWPGATMLQCLEDVLIATGHTEEAIAFLRAARERSRAGSLDQPGVDRWFLEALARAYAKAGQPDEARSLLKSAVEVDRRQPSVEAGGLGASLLALGLLELDAGNLAQARQHLAEARVEVNPYDTDRVWQLERAIGVVNARLGERDAAVRQYALALTALESVKERLRPEEFRLTHGFDQLSIYEEHAALLAAMAVQSGRPADADLAFQAAERKRTQVLWGLLSTGWSRIPSAGVPDQLRRLFDIEHRISAKQALLREQFAQSADRRNTAIVDALQRDLKPLQGEHARLLASMAQGQYRFAAPAALAASVAGPVRDALGPSRVLIEYLVTAHRTFAFVVSGSGTKVVPLAIGRDALRQQVRKLLLPFRQLRSGEIDLARLTYDGRAAHALYQAIFAPLRPSLGPVSEIVIVPDDILTFLPFDALVEQAPRGAARGPVLHAELDSEKFLLHRYAISYLSSSAQLLLRAADTAAPRQMPKRFFALANPAAGRTVPAPPASQDDQLKRQLRAGMYDAFLTPLPGAESEVQRIARHFPGDATAIVTGGGATEAAYESQAGQYGIVHFATHAVASDGQPLYSTMILAPDSAPGHDGFLQAFEVLRTPLQADLVVLSGCETALGAEDLGQGLVGLVAAFQEAGARSVLATLWSIDEATGEVMAGFYGAMAQGTSTTAALRQAKLQMLKLRLRMGNVEVSLAHPFFWAPFILVGAR
jgi:CHAT domain-containing protein